MRVALVHDWLTGLRGGERCLHSFMSLYPQADIFTMVHVPGATTQEIDQRVRAASFLSRFPAAPRLYRHYLPLYPHAIRSLDLSGYDLIISLSHAAAKNIRVPSGARHISFCFTPMRYVWDQARFYFGAATPLLFPLIRSMRAWDRAGAAGVDQFVAISRFVAARIRCFYGRSSVVVYPPVDTAWIGGGAAEGSAGEAFLYAGALVPYKRPDLVIEAFNRIGEPLWVVGRGPEERRLRRLAAGHIKFLGHLSDQELAEAYRRSRALVFPGTEDFGMVPIESLAAGRPVIGVFHGALRETLNGVKPWEHPPGASLDTEGRCGVFIPWTRGDKLSALLSAIYFFIEHEGSFSPAACRAQAALFSPERFRRAWGELEAKVVAGPMRSSPTKIAVAQEF